MTPIPDLKKPLDFSILEDKSVLITGGASGIGALIASQFVDYGACVTVADINKAQGQAFTQERRQKGHSRNFINFIATDVTNWQSQVTAFKAAIAFSRTFGIDIVVAAAGLGGGLFIPEDEEPPSLTKDPPAPSASSATFDVNAKGVYYTTKLAQHYFALPSPSSAKATASQQPFRKTVIMFSSLAGYMELNNVDYTASKWAVRGILRSARSQMEDRRSRLNLIAPWVMDTPMSKPLADLCREKGFPVGDVGDVVSAVVRCAVDDGICGRAIAVGAAETFDLRDDIEGLNAGVEMKKYLEAEAEGLMKHFGQRV
ncbi:hypothetical protein MMC21_008307 [Puttea exsequens]|nr:hypothetical protein [Puttea exsequens]